MSLLWERYGVQQKQVATPRAWRPTRPLNLTMLGVWVAALGICGAVWGFLIAYLYPVIYRLLTKVF